MHEFFVVLKKPISAKGERASRTEFYEHRRKLLHRVNDESSENSMRTFALRNKFEQHTQRIAELHGHVAELLVECSNLRSIAAKTICERDTLAAASRRWFDAAIAITADHNPMARMPWTQRWGRSLLRRLGEKHGTPSPIALANRARDAEKWELAVRYYRDALDIEPDNPEVWVQCGHALTKAGKISEADVAYQRSRELAARRERAST
jgi:tetratricopeptide (TPR) repeat protein